MLLGMNVFSSGWGFVRQIVIVIWLVGSRPVMTKPRINSVLANCEPVQMKCPDQAFLSAEVGA